MKQTSGLIWIAVIICLFPGCAGAPKHQERTAEQYTNDQQIYEPYKLKNTIEGYEEFINRYPGNQFIPEARRRIYRLKYDKYVKMDTIEGYREFIRHNPDNPHVKDALRKIESTEFRICEKEDALTCYKDFVARYPKSYFADDAKSRIREMEFKQLDKELRHKYGFDLLKYRLTLRRLKRDLALDGKENFAAFSCDAVMKTYGGKTYFLTNLIYNKPFKGFVLFSEDNEEDVFNAVVSEALLYLQSHFRHKGNVEGFGFKLSFASHYQPDATKNPTYFPVKSVSMFCRNLIDKKTLKQHAIIFSQEEAVTPKKDDPVRENLNTGIRASDGTFRDTILVMWQPAGRWSPANEVDYYRVYRARKPNGRYEPVGGKIKGTMYYDRDVKEKENYYYRVRGHHGDKAPSPFGDIDTGRAMPDGIKGPVIIKGAGLKQGTYAYKPYHREFATYQFAKNGACIETTQALKLKGKWRNEGDTLLIETEKEELRYSIKINERWEYAFTTHNGRRFHRMGMKQVPNEGQEIMRFLGKGHILYQGTGRARRKKDISVNATATLDKTGVWRTVFTFGEESTKTTTPHLEGILEVVEFNGNYFLSMPDEGPGYFKE